jgi:hypothetical protein
MNITEISDALAKLSDASSSAQQYGPFYFATLVLILVPLIFYFLVKKMEAKSGDADVKKAILSRYMNYFTS